AKRPINEGAVIECVPVILIPHDQVFGESREARRACRISWYVFRWGMQEGHDYVALPLGYGAIYNHSYDPKAMFRITRACGQSGEGGGRSQRSRIMMEARWTKAR